MAFDLYNLAQKNELGQSLLPLGNVTSRTWREVAFGGDIGPAWTVCGAAQNLLQEGRAYVPSSSLFVQPEDNSEAKAIPELLMGLGDTSVVAALVPDLPLPIPPSPFSSTP